MKTITQQLTKIYNKLQGTRNAVTNIWKNNGDSIKVTTPHTRKYNTWCCALMHLAADNKASIEELEYQIARLKEESKLFWNVETRSSGETCIFVITTPTEKDLEEKLIKLNFKAIHQFKRRNGYPQNGLLKMWVLNVA